MKYSIFRPFGNTKAAFLPASDAPIQAELFSVERLEQQAESLASAQTVTARVDAGRPLVPRLRDNARVLTESYKAIANSAQADHPITPAAEWLLDNFHIVEEQIRGIIDHLPTSFYRTLPKLSAGPLRGYPRVFGIAWDLVAHTDSGFDYERLVRFVTAYQRIQPLTIGELWAIAITLRVTLVENLRRLAEAIVERHAAYEQANALADRMLGVGAEDAESLDAILQKLGDAPVSKPFAVQLSHRLRDQDARVMPALQWLEDRMVAIGATTDQIVQDEPQIQGAMNVTVRNIITSMRLVSAIDWPEFFETVSLVDEALRENSDFAAMDFPTRNLYRREIEDLAEHSGLSEIDITRRLIAMCSQQPSPSMSEAENQRRADPGYYLLRKGRPSFERDIGFRAPMKRWLADLNAALGVSGYLGIVAITTAIILSVALLAVPKGEFAHWRFIVLLVFGIIPASDVALAIVNKAAIDRFGPAILPGLELREGVSADLRTIVVMPTLLTSLDEVRELVGRLEVHYLSSQDGELYFALLSDWIDSDTESREDDDALMSEAVAGIAALNNQYGPAPDGGARFFLFHRHRVWNKSQRKWLGWERKRGKLHELNRLLRGATDTTFLPVGGKPATAPSGVRYVITLDADTRLPREAAKRMIGKIAHPLNRPILDPKAHRVVEGHGILQPRVTPSLPVGQGGSLFQRAFSGANGLDPYAFAVSDVYQDLFAEGSFVGKGIYDVDCFEAALHGRIPESTVLSHDLLEGTFTRAALASDIELVEEFPSRYDVAAARQHRWVRGDWQLLPWIFWRGREKTAGKEKSVIPLIGRWKMADNLRRSLSAPSALLALLFGWTLPAGPAGLWTAFILATILFPLVMGPLFAIIPRRTGISKRSHFIGIGSDITLALTQAGFLITFLAHQAWLNADAIFRTVFRVFIHKRRMLEWTTAAQANYLRWDWRTLTWQLLGSFAFGIAAMMLIAFGGGQSWAIALPLVVLWMISPVLARWASRPPPPTGFVQISPSEAQSLRLVSRRTWRFFETFISAENHMLPPDNFQEDPQPVIANRTSPTNLGLYLLAVMVARDFGWQTPLDAVERLEATLGEMGQLERFRGHFYNWYDTHDLRPLEPKYISSVDSGNLAGHLVALANACKEMMRSPPIGFEWAAGINDALLLAQDSLKSFQHHRSSKSGNDKPLSQALDQIAELLLLPPIDHVAVARRLAEIARQHRIVKEAVDALAAEYPADTGLVDVAIWTEALGACVSGYRRYFDCLIPWAAVLAETANPALEDRLASLLFDATLIDLPARCAMAIGVIKEISGADIAALTAALETSAGEAAALVNRLNAIVEISEALYGEMAFDFLFDRERQLMSIGFQVAEGKLDGNYYDLLASEARLASFVAIARGDIPVRHWFRLGRTLTPVNRDSALMSWSGSMFEYLMPALVMRAPAGSLLSHTNDMIVRRQISYGAEHGVPWGISESQYNARDLEFTYQYSGFGVPDLGYKRTLGDDLVIAPYATALAAMIDPAAAARNFQHLTEAGGRGQYGWYDALDYTPERLPEGAKVAVVRAYMAHHQAMSIIAIANAVQDGRMRARFHAEPSMQATELLLQERMPRGVPVARPPTKQPSRAVSLHRYFPEMERRFHSPHSRVPRTHLLSNGRYAVMVTGAGSGYSRHRDIDVTRWREDPTGDGWGSYIFIRDMRTNDIWSAGYQPTAVEPETYEVAFSEDRAEFTREDGGLTTTLVVAVSPEDDAEVRRVSISNHGNRVREIELTSYAELVLAPHADDRSHQAFSKLFVETEFVAASGALLAQRRRRSSDGPQIWAAHVTVVEGDAIGDVQFETDRGRFIGRGHNLRNPAATIDGWPLSNTVGAVLDPIFSIRRRVRIPRGSTVQVAFWTMVGASRDEVMGMVDKHHDPMAYERAITFAWTRAQVQLHHLGITPDEAHRYQRIANRVIYSDPTMRAPAEMIAQGIKPASTLWANGISGDLPIVLIRIDDPDDLDVVRQLLRAHEYWRMKQLAVDFVILNERPASYVQDLQNGLEAMVRASRSLQTPDDAKGSVYVLRADLVSSDVRSLLLSAARVVLLARRGSLGEQIKRLQDMPVIKAPPIAKRAPPEYPTTSFQLRPELDFFNGFGGFGGDGREYVTILERGQWTPAPWINVIANRNFGFHVSTEGSGYTWSINSQQNQVTSWSNDPVRDPPGEVLYIRDEESGELWTPTALPIREQTPYIIRHGQGYSRFEHSSNGIETELLQYVPIADPIKISRLKLTNRSGRARRLSVTAYIEWVLGTSREISAPFIVTEVDPETGAIHATNGWSSDFAGRLAFADLNGKQTAWTGDRAEFLGRNGSLGSPAALAAGAVQLSKTVGAGLDPCAALQRSIRLAPDATVEVVVFLGEVATAADAQALVKKYRAVDLDAVLATATGFWDQTTGTIQVKTPDRALDIMVNRWLPYQVLACRVWARAGFYQASGAYGFRDQLQDIMALCASRPEIAREHILRAAARQFPEGDVQHWWLPETGRGIRTRISDDMVWLPYVVSHYVEVTGDTAILDESIPFLEGPVLKDGENEAFFQPSIAQESATLLEHCARGLDRSLAVGAHGLPLMGTGDWNDGMNQVGAGGKGESVWLGWFLYKTLTDFAHLTFGKTDAKRAAAWMLHTAVLKESLDNAWDGDWYRRAYFDDGSPLGSAQNAECQIDAIAQTWSVISGAGEPAHVQRAMAALEKYLVRRDEGLLLLFTPPFDVSKPNPGYIQGYPKGIRENGGQYTHGAAWSILAFAQLGDGDKAAELFAILNPINHGNNHAAIHRYRVEPYVLCGDVYSVQQNVGRGGWTWYTGSAAWMYRSALEGILGFHLRGTKLRIDPRIPRAWPGFEIAYRYKSSLYEIAVENPRSVNCGIAALELDGAALDDKDGLIDLVDDGATHKLRIVMG